MEETLRLESMSICERRLHREGFCQIAGIDEAGRGPLAGPVVAAACILPPNFFLPHLNDSKQLSAKKREDLFAKLIANSNIFYGIAIVDEQTIDRINILQATFLAMQQAVQALPKPPDYLLIDGNQLPHFDIPSEALVEGDGRSISIAAASILAKVTRDRIMLELDAKHPQYGFKQHKGYPTKQHREAIRLFGLSPSHRRSFSNI